MSKVDIARQILYEMNVNYRVSQRSVEFHKFSITQILREINFGDSKCAKSGISTHLEPLNLHFYDSFALFES